VNYKRPGVEWREKNFVNQNGLSIAQGLPRTDEAAKKEERLDRSRPRICPPIPSRKMNRNGEIDVKVK